jgi:hypothetical protein
MLFLKKLVKNVEKIHVARFITPTIFLLSG